MTPTDPQGAGETRTTSVDTFGRCVWCGSIASTGGCVNYKCPSKTTHITRIAVREEGV